MLEANINTGHFHYTVHTEQALLINQGKASIGKALCLLPRSQHHEMPPNSKGEQ